ncbi:MAG: ABC transporter ATP-binding protein [Thermocladium sp.]|jgi:branched-chain amino acid transport system ATP-binding protein
MLKIDKVSKKFGQLVALNNIDLDIQNGELKVIIGPNGAGKTTLINIVTGILVPDSGRILFNGIDITNESPHRRARLGLARTCQIPRPFFDLTVLENVYLGARYAGGLTQGEAMKQAKEAIEMVGLSGVSNALVRNLTTAQMKMMSLARALSQKPKAIFIDELGAGLSEGELAGLIGLIKRINDMGITVVYVGHIMRVVKQLSSGKNIVVLNAGSKIFEGTYEAAVSNPEIIKIYLGDKYASGG